MKKSTLISTLAMVVIVALALTTATFAWYTANSSVTASTKAVAAVAGDADLRISTDGTTYTSAVELGTKVDDVATISGLMPLSVNSTSALTVGAEYDDASAAVGILHGQYTYLDGETTKFKDGDPYTGGSFNTPIYIKNGATDSTKKVPVKMTVAVANDDSTGAVLTDGLRIAVFRKNADDDKYTLLGILGNSAYSFCDGFTNVEADKEAPGKLDTSSSAALATGITFDVNNGATATLQILVWLDGEKVEASEATKSMEITITFAGQPAVAIA